MGARGFFGMKIFKSEEQRGSRGTLEKGPQQKCQKIKLKKDNLYKNCDKYSNHVDKNVNEG